ncbi:MAG: hypothetical protein WCJ03_04435 [Bacteroidales bacterium]
MSKNIQYLFLFFILVGCVVYKPDSNGVSSPDYNQRVEVEGAHMDKVLTPIGVTSIAASTIAGAYYGSKSDLIKYNSGVEEKTSKPGNALIGAAVGFSASYAINRLMGWGKITQMFDEEKWVKKANKNYKLISAKGNTLYIIPKRVEPDFQIKNIDDINQFKSLFPNSQYEEEIVKRAIPVVSRLELLQVKDLYPNSQSLDILKKEYILRSKTIDELFSAKDLFKQTNLDIENKAFSLIGSLSDAIKFTNRFPVSSYKQTVEKKASDYIGSIEGCLQFNKVYPNSIQISSIITRLTLNLSREDLMKLIEIYPNARSVDNAKIRYIALSDNMDFYYKAIDKYPDNCLKIKLLNYKENIEDAKQLDGFLSSQREKIGDVNYKRLSESLRSELLENLLLYCSKIQQYNNFISVINNNKWLNSVGDKYIIKANEEIDKVEKQLLAERRQQDFRIAERNGAGALIQFIERFSGSDEASKANGLLNNYVQDYVVQTMDPFTWTAPGDRGFWTTWASNNRNYIKGAEKYNVFVAGRYKNKYSQPLTVKITVELNLIKRTSVSIFSSSSAYKLSQEFLVKLNSGEDKKFVCLFDNISGGVQIGKGLLSGGFTNKLDENNPYTIQTEFYRGGIPQNIIQQQNALIRNVLEKGNVDTKNWGGASINDITSGAFMNNDGDSKLIIHYNTKLSYSNLILYNNNNEAIKSQSWNEEGTHNLTFGLKKGKYYIEVAGCKKKYYLNLNNRQVSITIDDDCRSQIYNEDN